MIRWLEKTDSDDLYLSVITIGEVKKGINKLPASKKKQDLLFWLETLLEDYQSRILPVAIVTQPKKTLPKPAKTETQCSVLKT